MGGGDLNLKKWWHPGTMKNQDLVWQKEKQKQAEERKLELLRKEKDEEKNREELERLTGKKKKQIQMEWMYQQAPTASTGYIDEEKELYLLGQKRIDDVAPEKAQEVVKTNAQFTYGLQANTARDIQQKIREDPLFAFKRQEQASLQAILNNPLRLKQLKKMKEEKKKKKSQSPEDLDQSHHTDDRHSRHDPREDRHSRSDRDGKYSRDEPRESRRDDRHSRSDRDDDGYARNEREDRYSRSEREDRYSREDRDDRKDYRRSEPRHTDRHVREYRRDDRRQKRNRSPSPEMSVEEMKRQAQLLQEKKQSRFQREQEKDLKDERKSTTGASFVHQINKSVLDHQDAASMIQRNRALSIKH
ncbi:Pre-mRNA splicing factor-domain-containing protein [Gorgonomyces haynaldii]|nr:Pre-mRNA splicing factor-domain-containing protein [Gorgonomyces haynaldii]